jgi:hypothetical protein
MELLQRGGMGGALATSEVEWEVREPPARWNGRRASHQRGGMVQANDAMRGVLIRIRLGWKLLTSAKRDHGPDGWVGGSVDPGLKCCVTSSVRWQSSWLDDCMLWHIPSVLCDVISAVAEFMLVRESRG